MSNVSNENMFAYVPNKSTAIPNELETDAAVAAPPSPLRKSPPTTVVMIPAAVVGAIVGAIVGVIVGINDGCSVTSAVTLRIRLLSVSAMYKLP